MQSSLRRKECRTSAKYYICYTGVFAVCVWLYFGIYYYANKTLIWTTDGVLQGYPFLVYVRGLWREFFTQLFTEGQWVFPMWDLRIGEGGDVFSLAATTGYLFDPLFIVSNLVPTKYLDVYVGIMIIIKFYISGLAFSWYCFEMEYSKKATLAGSIVYIFSSYAMSQTSQFAMLWAMIFTPLVFLGLERVMKKRKTAVLILSVACLGIVNFYFLYMISIMGVIYCVVRYFDLYKGRKIGDFVKTAGYVAARYAIGGFLSAIVLLPTALSMLYSSRTQSTSEVVDSLAHYNLDYYKALFAGMVNSNVVQVGYGTYVWVNAIAVIAVILLLVRKEAPRYLKWMFGIMICMLLVPMAGKVLNGFSSVTNRWPFMFGFFAAVAVAALYESIKQMKWQEILLVAAYLLCSYFLCREQTVFVTCAVVFITLLVLSVISLRKIGSRYWEADAAIICCAVFSLAAICFNMNAEGAAYTEIGEIEQLIEDTSVSANSNTIEDDSVYRIAYPLTHESHTMQKELANQSLMQNYYGLTSYWSLSEAGRTEFYQMLELPTLWSSFNLYGFDDRSILNTLSSVKYYLVEKENQAYQPYGYSEYSENERGYIYQNDNYLPLGFVYPSYVLRDKFEDLNVCERQEVLAQSVVLETGVEAVEVNASPVLESYQFEYESRFEDMVYQDGTVTLDGSHGYMYVSVDEQIDGEAYIQFKDIYGFVSVIIENGDVTKYFNVKGETSKYKSPSDTFTVNIGKVDAGSEIKITFWCGNEFPLGAVNMYCLPMNHYSEQIGKLASESMTDLKVEGNYVTGNITVQDNGLLYMSIPYGTGWKAYVDGEPAEILKANIAYMAIFVEKGAHEIVWKYCTPGLKLGALLSAMAALVWFILEVVLRRRKHA